VRTIGIIGLGLLGSALADRFVQSGNRVLGFDLAADRRKWLVAAGGHSADSALEVTSGCDVLVLSLPDSDVVASVMTTVRAALRAGQLVIDTTTGAAEASAALGEDLARQGVLFLDATIAGSSVQVREAQATVMAGGQRAVFDSARDILTLFAKELFYVGAWGSGARMKLVVNLVLGLNRAVLAEGLTLAAALGLDARGALSVLEASPAYSVVMKTKGAKMLDGDFEPQAKLSQHLKDVRLILAAGERTGTSLPLSSVHRQLLERAEAEGFGQLDNSAIIRVFQGGTGSARNV
jgi:3-hydroxyisobutyrate dehydrogenase-like beta-hydroxyacid dehydrogenase